MAVEVILHQLCSTAGFSEIGNVILFMPLLIISTVKSYKHHSYNESQRDKLFLKFILEKISASVC